MENKRKYSEWRDLLSQAELSDNAVFRWWIVNLLLELHGDLDSISYCVRALLPERSEKAARRPNGSTRRAELPPRARR